MYIVHNIKKWLPMDHPYHHDTFSFEGIREEGEAPRKMTIDEIYQCSCSKDDLVY
jgi:hypothetical protein